MPPTRSASVAQNSFSLREDAKPSRHRRQTESCLRLPGSLPAWRRKDQPEREWRARSNKVRTHFLIRGRPFLQEWRARQDSNLQPRD